MSRPRGNTGDLFQDICEMAEQLAGPMFERATGPLPVRLQAAINSVLSDDTGMIATNHVVSELQRLVDMALTESRSVTQQNGGVQ